MTENKFLYAITDQDGKSFYEANGLVQTQGALRELQHAPDGFQDKSIEFKRDSRWWGVFRSYSFPLAFVRDGKSILNHLRYKLGFEFRAFFLIYILDFFINETHYGFGYRLYNRSEFDLTTVKKSETKIEVNLLDGGIEATLRAKENTNYEIPLADGTRLVKMDGVRLRQNATMRVLDVEYVGWSTKGNMATVIESKEGMDVNISVQNQENFAAGNNVSITNFLQVFDQITISLTGSLKFQFNGFVTRYYFTVRKQDADGQFISNIYTSPNFEANGVTHEQSVNLTITLNKGEQICILPFTIGPNVDSMKVWYYDSSFFINYDTTFKTTYAKTKTVYQVLSELIAKATDGKYGFYSSFLESKTEWVMTSGDALRGFQDAVIKTSISEIIQWLWCNCDMYFGITSVKEGTLTVKKATVGDLKDQFQLPVITNVNPIFQNNPQLQNLNKSVDLGNVRNLETDTDKEKLFNRIKVGCPNQSYEDINGRMEFNSTQYWGASVIRDGKELDLTTSVREDAMGSEYVRSNLTGKLTTDASTDNDTFAYWVEKKSTETFEGQPVYKLDRSETITGVVSPETHYNSKFSPKHKLIRKGRLLRSCLFGLDATSLKLTQAEKNANVTFGSLVEKAELPVASLGEPYFRPDFLKFETPYPIDLIELQNSDDLRRNCFKITWNEKDYYGFLHTISIQPWMNEVQSFTLISSPKNDLSAI